MYYSYKGIRDLGMFIFDYCKTQELNKKKEEETPIFKPYEGEQLSFYKKK